jgi:hypothetical protein
MHSSCWLVFAAFNFLGLVLIFENAISCAVKLRVPYSPEGGLTSALNDAFITTYLASPVSELTQSLGGIEAFYMVKQ